MHCDIVYACSRHCFQSSRLLLQPNDKNSEDREISAVPYFGCTCCYQLSEVWSRLDLRETAWVTLAGHLWMHLVPYCSDGSSLSKWIGIRVLLNWYDILIFRRFLLSRQYTDNQAIICSRHSVTSWLFRRWSRRPTMLPPLLCLVWSQCLEQLSPYTSSVFHRHFKTQFRNLPVCSLLTATLITR